MKANPTNGHLIVGGQSHIYDVDPVAKTAGILANTDRQVDGVAVSDDGLTIYIASYPYGIIGYDTLSGIPVFDSGPVPRVDGTALGSGSIEGNIYANTNFGEVWEISLTDPSQKTLIAACGSRGDFIAVDPTSNSLMLTQSDRIKRLTPPTGAGFGDDQDNDGVPDSTDNCRVIANSAQADEDQ